MSNNKIKGDEYEVFVKNYITNNLNKEAYLWKDIPEKILIDSGLIHSQNENRLKRKEKLIDNNPLIDVGIDILQKDEDNFTFVQCKNGYKSGLRIDDLGGFYMMMLNHSHMNGHVYYTSKLSIHIKENAINNRIQYIKLLMNETETKEEVKAETVIKPHDYQIEASNKIINYLGDNNDRAILSMPCGCGKTYTSYLIANKYDKVVMISPLRQFAKQNLDRYVEYGRTNTLLLDSDGTRDIDQINEFINNNPKFLISATYKSVDILQQLNLTNSMIIIDEFHNLSKNNVCNEEDDFYKLLISNNKFLLMSATPRIYELEDDDENNNIDLGEIVYNMTFTEAIEKKYICDYRIWLPSIHEDNSDLNELINEIGIDDIDNELKAKCMFLFKNLLYHGSKKCILYCQDTNNLNDIKDCIVKLNDFYAIDLNIQEITSETSYKNREKILTVFESSNKIELLLSIRICDECIDIPVCDSIYITYPSSCKIRTIQRLCRCIRTDKNNKFKLGNIFLWCNDYDKILNTLSGIKEYDVLFKNKISVLETNFMNKKEIDEKFIEDEKLIEKYILDIKEFRQYTWHEKLEMVKQYIDKNEKRPSESDKDKEIKQLGWWICTQQKNYKKKEAIMRKERIYNEWTQFMNDYQEYFLSNEKIWYDSFNKVKEYINENGKRPSNSYKNKEIKQLASWINTQIGNYKNKETIMKNEEIYNEWTNFMNEYEEYFLSNEEIWYDTLNKVKEYIDENSKRPSNSDKNKEIKQLASWISNQQKNYKKKEQIMKNEEIFNEWTQFMNEYEEYFLSNEDIWLNIFNKVKDYIDKNGKKPSNSDKNKEIQQLGWWIGTQQKKYKKKEEIMKNEEIYNQWTRFMNEYEEYFLSNEEIWFDNFNNLKNYIDKNKKRPSSGDKDKEIKQLASWIGTQQQKYKNKEKIMSNEEIYNEWTQFINKYEEYLLSNEEIWVDTFNKVKKYIDENGKRPSDSDKNIEIKQLGSWLSNQQTKYKTKEHIMKNEEIYNEFTNFMNEYEEYLLSKKEIWYDTFNNLKNYIDGNKKRPSNSDKNKKIKSLASWINTQQTNYKKKEAIMKNEEIYNEWTHFLEQYQEYFLSSEEFWVNTLNKVKEYIDKNKKRPSESDKHKEIKQLGIWISTQQQNYKKKEYIMKNEDIYSEWTRFMNKYEEYFLSNKEIWVNSFNKVKEYIDENKKRPSQYDNDIEIKQLGKWIIMQQINYKNKEAIMKNEEIYNEWTNFINEYQEYFLSNKEIWFDNLNKVKEYIDKNGQRPSNSDKNKEIKQLVQWLSHQQTNYKKKKDIMKNEEVYNEWTNFINEYQEYFN